MVQLEELLFLQNVIYKLGRCLADKQGNIISFSVKEGLKQNFCISREGS